MKSYLKQIKSFRDIFPVFVMVLTRQDRYLPQIEWSSKSWTHNLFRVYELLFWRRYGVRAEMTSYAKVVKGKVVEVSYACHTVESTVALTEQYIRKFLASLKFQPFRIYVPKIITPQGFAIPASPFLLAVAFDASGTDPWVSSGPVLTYAVTVSGSDRLMLAGGYDDAVGDRVTSVTYNLDALTRVIAQVQYHATKYTYVYDMIAPDTGTNDVVVTVAGADNCALFAISLTGANQSITLDSVTGDQGNGSQSSPYTLTTTVVAENCLLMGCFTQVGGDNGWSGGTNTTVRTDDTLFLSSTSTATVASGSRTQIYTRSGSARVGGSVIVSVAPPAAVGPANLKTYNTNPKANIKSIDTNLIANVKTLNTNP